jgi:hypothetical protein
MKTLNIISWACRIIAASIMLQTLFFKFTGAEESVYIFTKVGIEPWGRIGTGVAELIAAILILIPKTTVYGAVMAIGIMAGALATHLFILGIVVKDDGGQLFIYALLVTIASLILVIINRKQLLQLLSLKKSV